MQVVLDHFGRAEAPSADYTCIIPDVMLCQSYVSGYYHGKSDYVEIISIN